MVDVFQAMLERRGRIQAESGLTNISERVVRIYESIMGGVLTSGRDVDRSFGYIPITQAAERELGNIYLMQVMLEKRKALMENRTQQPIVLTDEQIDSAVRNAIKKIRPRSLRSQ
jgi:hypothetical protein